MYPPPEVLMGSPEASKTTGGGEPNKFRPRRDHCKQVRSTPAGQPRPKTELGRQAPAEPSGRVKSPTEPSQGVNLRLARTPGRSGMAPTKFPHPQQWEKAAKKTAAKITSGNNAGFRNPERVPKKWGNQKNCIMPQGLPIYCGFCCKNQKGSGQSSNLDRLLRAKHILLSRKVPSGKHVHPL